VTSAPDVMVTEPLLPQPFLTVHRHEETADTVTLRLQPQGEADTGFRPGQFSMLYAYGVGEVPISISGDPALGGYLEYTIRAVGGVTNALCAAAVGELVGVRGPYGTSWPLEEAEGGDLVIVAGGIGLAPLRGALLLALAHRERYNNLSLLYGARTPNDLLYSFELHEWRSRFDIEVEVTVDRAAPGWMGDVGVVTQLMRRIPFDPANTTALVCGPEVMMRATARQLLGAGVAPGKIVVSLERNMKCGVGLCGHCQLGPAFLCKDGPVVPYTRGGPWLEVAEL
jgi:NAD(P)H-flavin reductase